MVTILQYSADVTATTISTYRSELSAQLAQNLGKWSFELKMYKPNPASIGRSEHHNGNIPQGQQEAAAADQEIGGVAALYTLTQAHSKGDMVYVTQGSAVQSQPGVVVSDSFDMVLQNKMKSIWILRQTLRGDGAEYELMGDAYGRVKVRLANVFLQGTFRGLLFQYEYEGDSLDDRQQQHLMEFIQSSGFPSSNLIIGGSGTGLVQTGTQFVEALAQK
ncbi:Mediator of RNA polymerase II transcription subunit 20 [Yarrowia sp. B02]|nr:Mediator of RNA polymerase II transcription subunit 20 [Yarrowia sp. B02]